MPLVHASIPRDDVGQWVTVTWQRLLPVVWSNQGDDDLHYHLPKGHLKRDGNLRLPDHWGRSRSIIIEQLTSGIGIGVRAAELLWSRGPVHFKRIEEAINGLVDSLWTMDQSIFLIGEGPYGMFGALKKVIRNMFKVGCEGLPLLVSSWKEFTNYVFHSAAKTVCFGGPAPFASNNLYKALLKTSPIALLYTGEATKEHSTRLAHLCSSRQFPYMGGRTETKSLEAFKKVLTSTHIPEKRHHFEMMLAARRIGGICRKINESRPIPDGTAHISVSSSAELNYTIKDGGQSKAVRDALQRVLGQREPATKNLMTPFGEVQFRRGVPGWVTAFVPFEEWGDRRQHTLFDRRIISYPSDIFEGREDSFWGLDEFTGLQIMYCAWVESTKVPVCRTICVPEMGDKARMVTCTPYWVNVLQAPLSHTIIEALRFHPSVYSSFTKSDQAWESLKILCKTKYDPAKHSVLSSDLKDATNAQVWSITRAMLEGFCAGYGLVQDRNSDYFQMVLDTIGEREITLPTGEVIKTTRGVMMGEAIAKPSLTLLGLCVEELAYLKYTNSMKLLQSADPAPHHSWRGCHIGGDDHIAVGPDPYLDLITQCHLASGSMIGGGKHGRSKILVKYTEKMLFIKNLGNHVPFSMLDKKYKDSILVDSVKVRLLEKGQSTQMKKDEKNVAVGKSAQLMRTLEWLPWTYGLDRVIAVRELFIARMGNLLPNRTKNPRAFAAIHLPVEIGGYGLGLKSELIKWLRQSPYPTRLLIGKLLAGADIRAELKLLRRLNKNPSARGIPQRRDYEDELTDILTDNFQRYGGKTFAEISVDFPGADARETLALARSKGILSTTELVKELTRGTLFQNLLMKEGDGSGNFNTVPFVQTYRRIWEPLYEFVKGFSEPNWDTLNPKEVLNKIYTADKLYFFNRDFPIIFEGTLSWRDSPEDVFEDISYAVPLSEGFSKGYPSLSIGLKPLGLRR
jgi:hypothetical protein